MVSFSDLAVAVGPQLCCEKYLEDNFLEYILKSIFLTKKNAYNSANTDGSQVPFAESSLSRHFTQNMSLSASSKI